jgi:hypothetical protein
VAIFEVTMVFVDKRYEDHRRFLASVAADQSSPLQGFRQVGAGVALTFVVTTESGSSELRVADRLSACA